ncbi:hypothetical protein GW17_00052648 [Ensete ventricosum]|nr:hypothetical protein GW17_00052648 [Ensete ventricosum]
MVVANMIPTMAYPDRHQLRLFDAQYLDLYWISEIYQEHISPFPGCNGDRGIRMIAGKICGGERVCGSTGAATEKSSVHASLRFRLQKWGRKPWVQHRQAGAPHQHAAAVSRVSSTCRIRWEDEDRQVN